MKIKEKILDFFFPPHCPVCDDILPSGKVFCKECFNRAHEAKKTELGDISLFLLNYEPNYVTIAINMKKYQESSASEFFGKKLAQEVLNHYAKTFFSYISFIPSQKAHNQAKDIALVVSRELRLPIINVLSCNDTIPQHTLGLMDRPRNAKKKFFCKKSDKVFGNILLIDDIITTGSTMSVCADLLMQNGASFVQPAAVFKTLYKERYNA